MPKIITVLTLLLAILLFPPASLALISNNAVPGDAAYPLKRGLENVIYVIASLNPITRAWFSAARSDRRFEEIKILVTSGRSAKDSLQELVLQTDIAVKQIQKVEDPQKKKELIANLQQSIDKYDQGLLEIKKSYGVTKPSAPDSVTPPSPTPSPISSPSPVASPPPEVIDIEDTREDLEEIKEELEEEKEVLDMGKEILQKEDEKEKDSKKEKSDKDKDKSGKREEDSDKKTDKEGDKKEDPKTGKKSGN